MYRKAIYCLVAWATTYANINMEIHTFSNLILWYNVPPVSFRSGTFSKRWMSILVRNTFTHASVTCSFFLAGQLASWWYWARTLSAKTVPSTPCSQSSATRTTSVATTTTTSRCSDWPSQWRSAPKWCRSACRPALWRTPSSWARGWPSWGGGTSRMVSFDLKYHFVTVFFDKIYFSNFYSVSVSTQCE